jgi:hypothetical protein
MNDKTFKGLVFPKKADFLVPTSIDKKGNVKRTAVPDVIRLEKSTARGIDGSKGEAILKWFLDNEALSGDVKLNNYSFFCTADGLADKLSGDMVYEGFGRSRHLVAINKPLTVMTLQNLRDACQSVGKYLTVKCIYNNSGNWAQPKLCIHDSRVQRTTTRVVKPSEFDSFK